MKIILKDFPDDIKAFLNMDNNIHKTIIFYDNFLYKTFDYIYFEEKGESIYYFEKQYTIKQSSNNKYYLKNIKNKGFSIVNKKIKTYYISYFNELSYLKELFIYKNINWISDCSYYILSKPIIKQILLGGITNNLDIAKSYLKSIKIKASPKLFLRYMDKIKNRKLAFKMFSISKNPDNMMRFYLKETANNKDMESFILCDIDDMVKNACILNKKINFLWSKRRFMEEHSKWSMIITDIKIKNMKDECYNFDLHKRFENLPKTFTLLNTEKSIYEISSKMQFCLYSNYINNIKKGLYVAFLVNYKKNKCVVGLRVYELNSIVYIDQIRGFKNEDVNIHLINYIKENMKMVGVYQSLEEYRERELIIENKPDWWYMENPNLQYI